MAPLGRKYHLPGSMLPRAGSFGTRWGSSPAARSWVSVEFVHHVFRCSLRPRRVVNHGALTAFEAVLAGCFCLIDGHFGLRSEYASDCEHLGLGGSLKGENICVLGPDVSQFSTASIGSLCLG